MPRAAVPTSSHPAPATPARPDTVRIPLFLIAAVGDVRQAPPLSWPYRLHWVDTPAQWAARRRGAAVEE